MENLQILNLKPIKSVTNDGCPARIFVHIIRGVETNNLALLIVKHFLVPFNEPTKGSGAVMIRKFKSKKVIQQTLSLKLDTFINIANQLQTLLNP